MKSGPPARARLAATSSVDGSAFVGRETFARHARFPGTRRIDCAWRQHFTLGLRGSTRARLRVRPVSVSLLRAAVILVSVALLRLDRPVLRRPVRRPPFR